MNYFRSGQHLNFRQDFRYYSVREYGVMGLCALAAGLMIALLLTADWFLDRCRTTINVMGDMNVSCLLDGKTPQKTEALLQEYEQPPAAESPL